MTLMVHQRLVSFVRYLGAEGYVEKAGWALPEGRTYQNQEQQNTLDASMLYHLMEDEIAPLYYDKDENGTPKAWVAYIKKNIADIAPRFTMKRMIDDYSKQFYIPQLARTSEIKKDSFALAHEIVSWKNNISEKWSNIEVMDVKYPDSTISPLSIGEIFEVEITLKLNGIDAKSIGVEVVLGDKPDDQIETITKMFPLALEKNIDDIAQYKCEIKLPQSGVVNFAFRVFPKHEKLPHRQDFPLMKWI